MTKIRNPLSIENVLSNMISKLNEDEVKNLTNKSISHFRKCSDPDDKDHNLHLGDAIKPVSYTHLTLPTNPEV